MRTNELASMKQQVQELRSKVRTFIKLFFQSKIRAKIKLVFRLRRNTSFLFSEREEPCNEIKGTLSLLNCFSRDKYEDSGSNVRQKCPPPRKTFMAF